MTEKRNFLVLGLCILFGLATLGYLLGEAAVEVKEYERTVTAKGLSEREFQADIVIWPIRFSAASNDLNELYSSLENKTGEIYRFLKEKEIDPEDISTSAPEITDKTAQQYGGNAAPTLRYSAFQTVTVYSREVEKIRRLTGSLLELGKRGIVISGADYQAKTEYLFTRLNEVKPEMIEEATLNARLVARKFAEDSKSRLGKIKRASQGQFSIADRDKSNPHIKKVRVVSTVEYYLAD